VRRLIDFEVKHEGLLSSCSAVHGRDSLGHDGLGANHGAQCRGSVEAQPDTHHRSRPVRRRVYRDSNYVAAGRYWRPAYVAGGTHYGYVGAPYGYWPVGYVYVTRGYAKAPPRRSGLLLGS
jgi:hypothetical protein